LVALRKIPFNNYIITYILNNTNEIVAVSEKILHDISSAVKKPGSPRLSPLSIIPMGVSTQKYRPAGQQDDRDRNTKALFNLLFIGRIAEKKGLVYLLEAIPDIVHEFPDIRVLICGNGPDKEACEKKSRELHIESYVEFRGSISEQEKIGCLHIADILVVPSVVTGDGDTEGVPVVLLEGLAAGKAIVASGVGGIPDVIQDGYNGILIPGKDPGMISKTIITLLRDPGLRGRLARNALESSGSYDWECIADQYEQKLKGKP